MASSVTFGKSTEDAVIITSHSVDLQNVAGSDNNPTLVNEYDPYVHIDVFGYTQIVINFTVINNSAPEHNNEGNCVIGVMYSSDPTNFNITSDSMVKTFPQGDSNIDSGSEITSVFSTTPLARYAKLLLLLYTKQGDPIADNTYDVKTTVTLYNKSNDLNIQSDPIQAVVTNFPNSQQIFGQVTLSDTTTINNITEDVSITATNAIPIKTGSGETLSISGEITAMPAVTGTVSVSSVESPIVIGSGTVDANVTFPSSQAVTGTVAVSSINSSVTVETDALNPLEVTGTIDANVDFPSSQNVSGTVTVESITNAPTIQRITERVDIEAIQQTVNVSGNVTVDNQISGFATSNNQDLVINQEDVAGKQRGIMVGGVYKPTPGLVEGGDFALLMTGPDGAPVTRTRSGALPLTDTISSPQVPLGIDNTEAVYAPNLLHYYNGTTWDRVRGDTTNGLATNDSILTGKIDTMQTKLNEIEITLNTIETALNTIELNTPKTIQQYRAQGDVYSISGPIGHTQYFHFHNPISNTGADIKFYVFNVLLSSSGGTTTTRVIWKLYKSLTVINVKDPNEYVNLKFGSLNTSTGFWDTIGSMSTGVQFGLARSVGVGTTVINDFKESYIEIPPGQTLSINFDGTGISGAATIEYIETTDDI